MFELYETKNFLKNTSFCCYHHDSHLMIFAKVHISKIATFHIWELIEFAVLILETTYNTYHVNDCKLM